MEKCSKCKGTGFVPYYRGDGTMVEGIRVHCSCYEEPQDSYVPYSDDMIDFPVSYDFHCHYQGYYGQPIPLSCEPSPRQEDGKQTKIMFVDYEPDIRAVSQRLIKLEQKDYEKQVKKAPQTQGYRGLKDGS